MPLLFVMKDTGRPVPKRKRKKNSNKSKASPRATARSQSGRPDTGAAVSELKPQIRIEQALRSWRLNEAKHRKIPAFRIFGDLALRGIAATCPQNDAELLAVPGIGMSIVKKYGAQIYLLCRF
jgi:DNA topoisomerase III